MRIPIERFYDTKILTETDHKLPYDVTLKNLVNCLVSKYDIQIFLKETFAVAQKIRRISTLSNFCSLSLK